MNYVFTEKNFDNLVERFVYGVLRTGYNKDCFSTSEVLRYRAVNVALDDLIEQTKDQGYCIHSIFHPVLSQYGEGIGIDPDPNLKQSIDQEFQVDLSQHSRAIDYALYLYDRDHCAAA